MAIRKLTLGSLFNGISGWILAGEKYGVKTLWESEIDDYCQAVTHYHFPEVKQLGDITKIDVNKLEPVDIICAGSPCQDLSVAGKREGLSGERSGLFRTAIDIVHRLRNRTGMPRYFVWENVPGAFSSNKGLDFRAVLEKISQTEIPMPACGKWAESGMVEWDSGSLAWRVLDAQYWGVPQRRKRIFLVADFGGFTAGEILFVEQGLPRDSSESEGTGKEIAGTVREGVDNASRNCAIYESHPSDCRVKGPVKVSPACTAKWHKGSADTPLVMSVYENHAQDSRIKGPLNVAPTVSATFGMGGNNTPMVHTIAIGIDQQGGKGQANYAIEKSPTLAAESHGTPHAVCYSMGQTKTVRRLTPLEAERLQALPDGYTDIEFNGKPAPDSKRYKVLGNGMAQVCADYVIRRIVEVNK